MEHLLSSRNIDLHYFIERDAVLTPIIELGGAGRRMPHLVAADSPNAFLDNTPTAKLVRQVLGAIAEFDKAMLVTDRRSCLLLGP